MIDNMMGAGNEIDFIELAKKRYSVRKFQEAQVEQEKIDRILEAGNIAPTARNQQPQRIYVCQSKEALDKIDSLTECRYGAPVVLVFTYNKDEDWKNPLEEGVNSGVTDVSIVATHVMLRAAELDLGTCWVGYFPNTKLEKSLGIPENERSVLIMPVGYPARGAKPADMHYEYKGLHKTVKYL